MRQAFGKSQVWIMPDPKWHPKEEWHSLVRNYPKWLPKKNDTSLTFTKMTTQQNDKKAKWHYNDKKQNDTQKRISVYWHSPEWSPSEWQRVKKYSVEWHTQQNKLQAESQSKSDLH